MSQPDGANYVVLYQMLCLKTINTHGRLERQIGEVIIPYDAEKIQRDCKWFSIDTVRVALTVFQKLGLIYQEENGVLLISNFENMVGSETDYAIQKRNQRQTVDNTVDNVHTDIRYKILDKEKTIVDKSTIVKEKRNFQKPTVDEIRDYCQGLGYIMKPEEFFDFYESKGWRVGNAPMKDWKAAARNWERREKREKKDNDKKKSVIERLWED